jgi:hypothetical protein
MNWDDGNALHPVAILVFVALLLPVALWFEHRDRKRAERERDQLRQNIEHGIRQRNEDAYRRLYRDILSDAPPVGPRVTESKEGVFVRASCEAEAAEILYLRFCSPVRAA